MKALQATCIVGAIAFTGMIHQVGGNTPGVTVPDAMPQAAVSAETPGAPALSAAVPEASAGPGTALAHVPAKWTPVRRQEHARTKESRACSDSEATEHALERVGLDPIPPFSRE